MARTWQDRESAVLEIVDADLAGFTLADCVEYLEELSTDVDARLEGIKSDIRRQDRTNG